MTAAVDTHPLLFVDSDMESDPDQEANPQNSSVGRSRNRYAKEGYHFVHNNNNKEPRRGGGASGAPTKSKPSHEKILCVLLVLSGIAVICLASALIYVSVHPTSPQECESEECVQQAGTILAGMNTSADPCHSFFDFACGGFMKNVLPPPSFGKYGVFQEVYQQNKLILQKLLDAPGSLYKGVNSTAIQKAKDFYKTCLNVSATQAISTDRLFEVVKDVGSWPLLNNTVAGVWDEGTWDLESALSKVFWYGSTALFDVGVSTDDKDSSRQRIKVGQGGTTLSRERYVANATDLDQYKAAFVKFFKRVVELLGGTEDVTKDAEELWEFERALAEAFQTPEEQLDIIGNYNLMTVEDAQDVFGNIIDLSKYLGLVFKEEIPDSEEMIVSAKDYILKLEPLVSRQTTRELAIYVGWHPIVSLLPVMPLEFQLALQDLNEDLSSSDGGGGGGGGAQMWESCVGSTQSLLGFATGALYVEEHFTPEDKLNSKSILANIKAAMKENFPKLTWMDEATKAKALEKLEFIKEKIGYPDFVQDPERLDDYYGNLTVVLNKPFENELSSRRYLINKNLMRRNKPTDKTEWSMSPDDVNAYYAATKNEIVFPAGILQKPFYSKYYPKYSIYASIGMVIGHELTHAFDTIGGLYDKYGNLNNWWTNQSSEAYQEKTQCLVDEYSKFSVGNIHLNGKTTLSENLADNGGLKNAYRAYKILEQETGLKELPLPGLNLTIDQTFFLNFAQLWCAHYSPDYAKMSIQQDVHSYAKFRIIGTLYNIPAFAEAYHCPADAPMNPHKKCGIW